MCIRNPDNVGTCSVHAYRQQRILMQVCVVSHQSVWYKSSVQHHIFSRVAWHICAYETTLSNMPCASPEKSCSIAVCVAVLWCVLLCCSMWCCVAVCVAVLQRGSARWSVAGCVTICQCLLPWCNLCCSVAVCVAVLQCVLQCCSACCTLEGWHHQRCVSVLQCMLQCMLQCILQCVLKCMLQYMLQCCSACCNSTVCVARTKAGIARGEESEIDSYPRRPTWVTSQNHCRIWGKKMWMEESNLQQFRWTRLRHAV